MFFVLYCASMVCGLTNLPFAIEALYNPIIQVNLQIEYCVYSAMIFNVN